VAEADGPSTRIHSSDEELRDDHAWINKLARYLENDPRVLEEVQAHIVRCRVCNNVIEVWEKRRDRHNFLLWARGRNGTVKSTALPFRM
jgi:hypothetical protein